MIKIKVFGLLIVIFFFIIWQPLLLNAKSIDVDASDNLINMAKDAGNKICTVSGEKIEEETKATYEYRGKIYNFCCASCIEEFKSNQEKYIKIIEEEKKIKENVKTHDSGTMQHH